MKKFLWIAALFAALALLVTGCPGGGDDLDNTNEENMAATNVYFGLDGGDQKQAGMGPLTLTENYVRIFWDMPNVNFNKLKISFSLSEPANISVNGAFQFENAAYVNGNDYLDLSDGLTYEEDPSEKFSGIEKRNMIGICFVIENWETGTTFTINEVTFIGINDEPPPPPTSPPYPEDDSQISIAYKTNNVTATVKGTGWQKVETGNLIVAWNPNTGKKEYRVEVEIPIANRLDISSGYTKFKMNWSSTGGSSGSFNIRLHFTGDRLLSKQVNTGSAEFNFNSDHPSWAAGTDWGGAAVGTITGFEIFSDDSNISGGTLTISNICFE